MFPELSDARLAKDRIVDPGEVARRDPEIIFASWCGKKMRKATIQERPGWDRVSAVRAGHKPGTRVVTVRSGTCSIPTLLLEES